MHIAEGVLSSEILIISDAIVLALVVYLFKKVEIENIGKISAFSALFFVASFIHIPIGPTSIHLILSGIIGAFLGIDAILAIFIALIFQGFLFGYGGITTLGINTIIVATPALLGYFIYTKQFSTKDFFVGAIPILVSVMLLALVLMINGEGFATISKLVFLANIPLVIIEGIITFFALKFLKKVKM